MVFICVEMYVFSESNIICYVSVIKEKWYFLVEGFNFQKKVSFDPETASPLQYCMILVEHSSDLL